MHTVVQLLMQPPSGGVTRLLAVHAYIYSGYEVEPCPQHKAAAQSGLLGPDASVRLVLLLLVAAEALQPLSPRAVC